MQTIYKQPPINWAKLIVAAILLTLLLIGLFSCNLERKALAPYKAVNSDVDTSFQQKKTELVARKCNDLFPIQVKTIVIDSTKTRLIKVTDNALVNRLKAQLSKGCPQLDIDSILNEYAVVDTLYVERWRTTTNTVKDTIYNWRKQSELDGYKQLILIQEYKLQQSLSDAKEAHKTSNKWKLYFFLLLTFGVAFKVVKTYLKIA